MEYTPSFRDNLYADIIPSFSHAITDDRKYGIPELNKFPMPDAAHVRSAIKFFNYVIPAHEQQLASAILARMQEYGISADSLNVGDENRFKKYLQHDSLMHHGIKGQKWGVRRYQNADGSLTARGQKRYNKNKQYLDQIRANEDRMIKNNKDYLDRYAKTTEKGAGDEARDYLRKQGFDDDTINRAIDVTKAQRDRYQAMGEDVLKHQIDMSKKISDIDPGAQSYRKTKKLVKDIMKDSVAYEQKAQNAYLNSPQYLRYRRERFGY